jgi:hypothetical protein
MSKKIICITVFPQGLKNCRISDDLRNVPSSEESLCIHLTIDDNLSNSLNELFNKYGTEDPKYGYLNLQEYKESVMKKITTKYQKI